MIQGSDFKFEVCKAVRKLLACAKLKEEVGLEEISV